MFVRTAVQFACSTSPVLSCIALRGRPLVSARGVAWAKIVRLCWLRDELQMPEA